MTKTKLMGILNVTPDSFFDESRFLAHDAAVSRGIQMAEESADILDIGGESTRPGSLPISVDEERQRVIPVIETLYKKIKIPISIDTTKPQIAAEAVEAGASLINDVSGFSSMEMREVAASANVDICVMHMLDKPTTMQDSPYYEQGVTAHILEWFEKRVNLLIKAGVKKERIILDPGIGFGKTVAHNVEIIHNLKKFKTLGFPLLLGVSRKSFMTKILNRPASELLSATIVVNTIAIQSLVDIIRVHDVEEHRKVIDLLDYVKE